MSETFEKISAVLEGEVPAAGGEVETLAHVQADRTLQWLSDGWRSIPNGTELVDRAHIIRLQAENAALQQRLNVADQRVDGLQSDLTAARELLEDCLGPVRDAENNADDAANERLYHNLGNAIRAALAHQSAPAAKDGE